MTEATLQSSSYSQYAARAVAARPPLVAHVAALASAPLTRERIDARFDALCAEAAGAAAAPLSEDALKRALRQLRTEVFCAVMERDLTGKADVAEVTGAMTDLAETTIQRSEEHTSEL